MGEAIAAGIISEGRSRLSFHALRPDGTAACSSYLHVSRTGLAHFVPTASRCKTAACRKLFAEADTLARVTARGGEG